MRKKKLKRSQAPLIRALNFICRNRRRGGLGRGGFETRPLPNPPHTQPASSSCARSKPHRQPRVPPSPGPAPPGQIPLRRAGAHHGGRYPAFCPASVFSTASTVTNQLRFIRNPWRFSPSSGRSAPCATTRPWTASAIFPEQFPADPSFRRAVHHSFTGPKPPAVTSAASGRRSRAVRTPRTCKAFPRGFERTSPSRAQAGPAAERIEAAGASLPRSSRRRGHPYRVHPGGRGTSDGRPHMSARSAPSPGDKRVRIALFLGPEKRAGNVLQ